jgi:hypothetical protein
MALKNAFRASLQVDGKPVGFQYWDAFTGGKNLQKEVKYTPYDGIQRTFTGLKETDNITVESAYDESVHGKLIGGPGDANDLRGRPALVTVQDLVPGSNPPQYVQNRPPLHGLVLEVVPPDGDSNDASTIVKIQIIISVGSTSLGAAGTAV